MIGVVNYGAGNLGSVMNAFDRLGLEARFCRGPEELGPSSPFDRIVFPGDGHFATAMEALNASGYAAAIRDWAARDRPFLGICIGLQLLFDSSEEAPGVQGLGILPGTVKRFPGRKVPQIGWNRTAAKPSSRLFSGVLEDSFFYYIHSYYCAPERPEDTAATANYYLDYCAAAERGRLAAVQFHPEKSGRVGLELLRTWSEASC